MKKKTKMNYGKDTIGYSAADQEQVKFDMLVVFWTNYKEPNSEPNLHHYLEMRKVFSKQYLALKERAMFEEMELKKNELIIVNQHIKTILNLL